MCLATTAYVYVHVCGMHSFVLLFFSTGGKFQLVSNFTELHALIQAAYSYGPLYIHIRLVPRGLSSSIYPPPPFHIATDCCEAIAGISAALSIL